MTNPCSSECPAGDCAGCVFPPRAQCVPEHPCSQAHVCARADARCCDPARSPIDASGLRHSGGSWCPLFIDTRGIALSIAP